MHDRIPLVLALIAAAVAAGCVGADLGGLDPAGADDVPEADGAAYTPASDLSTARFDDILYQELHVTTDDDVEIDVDLWRPDAADAPGNLSDWDAPVILVYSPYNELTKNQTHPNDRPSGGFFDWMIDHFTQRGYAVAIADARGTRESGGCMDVAGPKEVQAGARVVETLADQDWSNGKVGMFGVSYPARTQLGIAPLDPEGLETIVPVAGISDYYSYFYYQGVPREGNNPGTYAGYSAISLIPHASEDGLTNYPGRETCAPEKFQHGLDLSGEWDDYWAERNYNADADQVTASMWLVHGFEDWNVVPRSVLDYYDRIDTEKRAWLLQMEHNYPHANSHEPDWSRPDFKEKLHAWYDRELLGRDVGGHDGPPVEVQDSSGRWRAADTWPPEDTRPRTFQLGANGTLAEGQIDPGARTYIVPPEHEDRTLPAGDDTELVYESQPLQEPLHFAGWPELELTVSMEGESTHLMWHLEAVAPGDGAEPTLLTRGYLDTAYRNGVREGPEPMEPGEVETLTLTAHPQDDVVPAGHSLRLTVTGDDPYSFSDTSETAAHQVTVHHGASPSLLSLPTVDPPEDAFLDPPMEAPS